MINRVFTSFPIGTTRMEGTMILPRWWKEGTILRVEGGREKVGCSAESGRHERDEQCGIRGGYHWKLGIALNMVGGKHATPVGVG